MTTQEQHEKLVNQILFRHRVRVKKGRPNTRAEVEAIRFALAERDRIKGEVRT